MVCAAQTKFWLAKSEPNTYSIEDLERDKSTLWDGVRNYQARNFLKQMNKGDLVLFYHSNIEPVGIAGVARVIEKAIPEPAQFDKKSEYYDAAVTIDQPRWFAPRFAFKQGFSQIITIDDLRAEKQLRELLILRKGNRLSITPVSKNEYDFILSLAEGR